MPGEGIVPPQGMTVIDDNKTIYGLPLAVPSGGAGIRIKINLPNTTKTGSGQKIAIIGDFIPTPPRPEPIDKQQKIARVGSGVFIKAILSADQAVRTGGSGTRVTITTPTLIRNGGGMRSLRP